MRATLLEHPPARLPSNGRDICARKSRCSSPTSNASSGLVVCVCVDPAGRETSSCSPPPLRIYESWPSFNRCRWSSPSTAERTTARPIPITGFTNNLSRNSPQPARQSADDTQIPVTQQLNQRNPPFPEVQGRGSSRRSPCVPHEN